MAFLKTLFSVFSAGKKQDPPENPLALPEDASLKIAQEKITPYQQAARDTLEVVQMPSELKERIVDYFAEINLNDRNKTLELSDEIFKKLQGVDWSWTEWDYWSKKCVELDLCPYNMPWPLPDVLDLDEERKKYSPDRVFNICTLKAVKERLQAFPETASMKKAEVVEFLKANHAAWCAVIDPHVEKIWNGKKHWEGATSKVILDCLLDTIDRRGRSLFDRDRMTSVGLTPKEEFVFDDDEKLFKIAKNDQNTPWQKPYGHPLPSGDMFYSSL